MKNKTKVCVTIDTEGDAASNPNSTFLGIHLVVPKLLDLFAKYGVKATFFIQEDEVCNAGYLFTDLWKSCEEQGHEIGYHAHGIIKSPLERQDVIITRGLEILRNKGLDPVSYRGGRFHLTGHILEILEKNGIKYDSSVVPGLREVFPDGLERCNHIGSPTKPYFPSYQDHTKPGNSRILELPINKYPYFPEGMWGGILTGTPKDVVLFDFFHETRKDKIIIVLLHSWEGLSIKIRRPVRSENYGKIQKAAFESLKRIFSSNFLTNAAYFSQLENLLEYISAKEDVYFKTIKQVGESWHNKDGG